MIVRLGFIVSGPIKLFVHLHLSRTYPMVFSYCSCTFRRSIDFGSYYVFARGVTS